MTEKALVSKIVKCSIQYDDHIPEVSLSQYLLHEMSKWKNCVAIVSVTTKEEFTYGDLIHDVNCLAAGLQASGLVKRGQCVAMALPNSIEFVVTLLAVSQVGAFISLINPVYTPRELKHVSSINNAGLWICTPEFVSLLSQLDKTEYKTLLVDSSNKERSQWHSVLKSGESRAFQSVSVNVFEDLVTMPFSSGTTGLPKGVMLTHHNLVTALCNFKAWCPYTQKDVNLGLLPMFHQYGCLMVLTTLAVGAKAVILRKFSFPDMLHAIQDYKVTMIPLVPPVALLLSKHPSADKFDLSSVRAIISSAAPLSLDIINTIISKYKWEVLQGYGMTECTLASHFTPPGQRKYGSVGQIMPFFEGKIADPNTGVDLGVKEVGEICVRGFMVMKGYRGNPGATAAMIDSNNWLHTGDIGYYDEEGFFYVVDRLKELIKYKGMQIAPSELEHLLLTHEEVADAAVIGIPDEFAGELPRAYVVKRPGSTVSESDIVRFVEEQVAPFKRLRGGVIFIDAIPKLLSGKILRRELRALSSKL
ncbi:hypothetical protein DAPPUDRAFT_303557 [Daphnia pulex]|uniref:Luciferin 4-monooxygenase n=1 Tax=Daphnia pulex TaxID=6669 RepID=E9HRD2_DAPPU|nr:hypothetical protein DAPPUDRAFT_303557 [Daphnia pulex]|eukprot:EFX65709.1 hypothetical protein DAPPUDRAFT_303557 [Daphnia pulex]